MPFESFNFDGDRDFEFTGTATFSFEILGYNTVDNNGSGDFFDVDEISVKGVCGSCVSAGSRNAPMLAFEAFTAQREVALQWATNTGYRNNYYIIEKSTDGSSFEELARVENSDLSDAVATYNGIDPTPSLGDNYYRIKQVYTDGSFDYTDIKNIQFNIDLDGLSMYPNPAQNVLNFNLNHIVGKEANIHIINNFGQVVNSLEIDKVENGNVQMTVDNLPNGFYQVMIQAGNQRPITRKLIIEKLY